MQDIPVFNPASLQERSISDLLLAVLAICGVILGTVTGLAAHNLVRSWALIPAVHNVTNRPRILDTQLEPHGGPL
jgi:hypothetical protein